MLSSQKQVRKSGVDGPIERKSITTGQGLAILAEIFSRRTFYAGIRQPNSTDFQVVVYYNSRGSDWNNYDVALISGNPDEMIPLLRLCFFALEAQKRLYPDLHNDTSSTLDQIDDLLADHAKQVYHPIMGTVNRGGIDYLLAEFSLKLVALGVLDDNIDPVTLSSVGTLSDVVALYDLAKENGVSVEEMLGQLA